MGVKDEDKGLHAHWHDHVSGMETHSHPELVRLISRLRRIEEAAKMIAENAEHSPFCVEDCLCGLSALRTALDDEEET